MNANSHNDPSVSTDSDIVLSVPDQRRRLQWLIAAMIAVVLLLSLFGFSTLKHATDTHDTRALTRQLEMVFYGLSVLLLVTAAYAGWHARRIFGSSQYPPPGSWLLRDTRLLRGDRARSRGWCAAICAAISLLLAVYAASLPSQIELTLKPAPAANAVQIAAPHG